MLHTISKQTNKPPIITIYSPPKFGKSTFGSRAPNPVFIQTEDGVGNIDVPAFPLAKTYKDVLDAIAALATQDHTYKSVVLDSLDWLEPLIHKQICDENKVKGIEMIGYGKGYVMALDLWREYVSAVKYLRDKKNMTVVQIGHAEIKRFDNPQTQPYDRYQLKLHKGAAEIVMESSDVILFGNYFVGVTKDKTGFSGDRVRAIGSGERVLYTQEQPAFKAGSRFNLPPEIPFDESGIYWSEIKKNIPYYSKDEKN